MSFFQERLDALMKSYQEDEAFCEMNEGDIQDFYSWQDRAIHLIEIRLEKHFFFAADGGKLRWSASEILAAFERAETNLYTCYGRGMTPAGISLLAIARYALHYETAVAAKSACDTIILGESGLDFLQASRELDEIHGIER